MIKAGPLAASTRDAGLAYLAMADKVWAAHTFEQDHAPQGLPPPHTERWEAFADLQGVRLGVFPAHFNDADPEVRARCQGMVDGLRARGAVVVEIDIPHMRALSLSHGLYISAEFAIGHDWKFQNGWPLEANTVVTVGLGKSVTGVELLAANKLRGWAMRHVRQLFAHHRLHAIVSPTTGTTAPEMTPAAEATPLHAANSTLWSKNSTLWSKNSNTARLLGRATWRRCSSS